MPRRDRFGDEDDYRDDYPPRRRKTTNPALIIGLVLGGVLLVVLVCGGLFAMMAFRGADAQVQQAQAVQAERAAAGPAGEMGAVNEPPGRQDGMRRLYTRDEFKQFVMGKSEQEVIDALGKPNVADEEGDAKLWIYRNRTTVPATGKTDAQVSLRLQGGKVIAVDF
jgi:hypothetical protein